MRIIFSISMLLLLSLSGCNRCRYGCINGVCIQKDCSCDQWYEGDACERSILLVHEGVYTGELVASDTTLDTISTSLTVYPGEPDRMRLEAMELDVKFTSRTRFQVPLQAWKGFDVKGEGEMLIELLSMQLSLTDSLSSLNALLEARKQE